MFTILIRLRHVLVLTIHTAWRIGVRFEYWGTYGTCTTFIEPLTRRLSCLCNKIHTWMGFARDYLLLQGEVYNQTLSDQWCHLVYVVPTFLLAVLLSFRTSNYMGIKSPANWVWRKGATQTLGFFLIPWFPLRLSFYTSRGISDTKWLHWTFKWLTTVNKSVCSKI